MDNVENEERWQREIETGLGMPPIDVLRFHFRKAGQLVVASDELGDLEIPSEWRSLLEAQERGLEIPWDLIWGDFWDYLPAIRQFLNEKCYGIAILTASDKPPELAYMFGVRSRFKKKFGNRLVCMMSGGTPIDASLISDERLRRWLKMMPSGLRAFYTDVHDGWCDESGAFGPCPLASLRTLHADSDSIEFEDGRWKGICFDDLVGVVYSGIRSQVFVDLKNSTDTDVRGVYYDCSFKEDIEVNVDFWKAANGIILQLYDSAIPAT